ncbi:hypothetical protein [Actinomycetospora aeridis]|uniref:Uncharacterized protein n=1 Tax=Actinomycetospora aeridis TaxID=3129231 RepID=A0ABU8N0Y1_9PSEU
MRWELPDGVEVLADEVRVAVAQRAVAARADLVSLALRFLRSWLHEGFAPDRGEFELVTLEAPASREDGGDVVLRFVFTLAADPHEYGYTWFEVLVNEQEPPRDAYWPVGMRVGFW